MYPYLNSQGSAALTSSSLKQLESDADGKVSASQLGHAMISESSDRLRSLQLLEESADTSSHFEFSRDSSVDMARDNGSAASASGSPWYQLRKDTTNFVSQTLQRGRKNLWQLTTSRVSVLLSSTAVSSTSIHQFLRIYEDLNIFILAGEAFCGVEATEFRNKLKAICENYFAAFHRQNVHVSSFSLFPLDKNLFMSYLHDSNFPPSVS